MERKSIYNYKNIILKIEKIVSDIKREPVKVLSAVTLGTALIASGCDATNILKTVSPTDSPLTSSSTIKPSPTPESTVEQTIEPTLEPSVEPTSTPDPVILSSKGDKWCHMRFKDRAANDISRGAITIGYIEVNGQYVVNLCERAAGGEIADYSTTKIIFEKEGNKFVPTEVMNEVGEAKFLGFDTISAYMTETLKLSQETAQMELAKIKTGFDLITWYVTYVPKKQQIVIPWKDLEAFLSADHSLDYNVDLKSHSVVDNIKAGEYSLRDLYKDNAPQTSDEIIETVDLHNGNYEYYKRESRG